MSVCSLDTHPKVRGIGFVWVLIFLILTTLVFTVGLIASIAYFRSKSSLRAIEKDHYRVAVFEATNEVRQVLRPDERIIREFQILLQRGLLSEEEVTRIGAIFVERLRAPVCLTGLNFAIGDTGRYVGAEHIPDGQFILKVVNAAIPYGHQVERLVLVDGSLGPPQFSKYQLFDPRERPWYVSALYAMGKVVWLAPYKFFNGQFGISAACAVFAQNSGRFIGVLCADFSLQAIQRALSGVLTKQRRLLFLTMQENPVAESSTLDVSLSEELRQRCLEINLPQLQSHPDEVAFGSFTWKKIQYIASLNRLRLNDQVECCVGLVAPESEFLGVAQKNALFATGAGVGGFIVAVIVAVILSMKLAYPLSQIGRDLERVARFEILTSSHPSSLLYEVQTLGDSTERMKRGIQSFARYVPDYVVRKLLRENKEAHLEANSREISVFASDLEGFTRMAEKLPANRLVEALDEYFELVIPTVEKQFGGMVDKLLGDGILAFFNALDVHVDHAKSACSAAIMVIQQLEKVSQRRHDSGLPTLRARIGLASGIALVGNFGTESRLSFTAAGEPVTTATQLEQLNKRFGTHCLATEETYLAAGNEFEWRALGETHFFNQSVKVLELMGRCGKVKDSLLQARDLFEKAQQSVAVGDTRAAYTLLELALKLRPADLAALSLKESLTVTLRRI